MTDPNPCAAIGCAIPTTRGTTGRPPLYCSRKCQRRAEKARRAARDAAEAKRTRLILAALSAGALVASGD